MVFKCKIVIGKDCKISPYDVYIGFHLREIANLRLSRSAEAYLARIFE